MECFEYQNAFRSFFYSSAVPICRLVVLNVDPDHGSIHRHFLIEIVSHVLVYILLTCQLFCWINLHKHLFHGLFEPHIFVVVVTTNFFDLVAKFGVILRNISIVGLCCLSHVLVPE